MKKYGLFASILIFGLSLLGLGSGMSNRLIRAESPKTELVSSSERYVLNKVERLKRQTQTKMKGEMRRAARDSTKGVREDIREMRKDARQSIRDKSKEVKGSIAGAAAGDSATDAEQSDLAVSAGADSRSDSGADNDSIKEKLSSSSDEAKQALSESKEKLLGQIPGDVLPGSSSNDTGAQASDEAAKDLPKLNSLRISVREPAGLRYTVLIAQYSVQRSAEAYKGSLARFELKLEILAAVDNEDKPWWLIVSGDYDYGEAERASYDLKALYNLSSTVLRRPAEKEEAKST